MKQPKVSIIILNWNGLDDTIECLESIKQVTYSNYEVILVDNGSEGNDADILETKYGKFLTIIRNNKNYGFTGGNNIAVKFALDSSRPDYFLLLNNDTTVDSGFLTEMIKVSEDAPEIGIAGPKTCLYHSPKRFQFVWFEVDMNKGRAFYMGAGEIDRGQYEDVREVGYVAGSCFLIKRSVIDSIGLLDEAYVNYWEETDYCIRARKVGYKIVYVPGAKIWHKVSQTLGTSSPLTRYYLVKNSFRFMKKHATQRQYYCFLLYFFGYYFWWNCASCLLHCHSMRNLYSLLRGVRDGLSIEV